MDRNSRSGRMATRNSKGSGIPTSIRRPGFSQCVKSTDKFQSQIPRPRSSSMDRFPTSVCRQQLFTRTRSSSAERGLPSSGIGLQLFSATPLKRSTAGSNIIGKKRSSILEKKRTLKDPRPLHNRSYQNQCVQRLFEFLQRRGYPHPINIKLLSCPSKVDFLNIFQFLYSWWDPHYVPSQKCEEEIPKIMKSIYYPISINKSTMMTVGSPHSWPTILGLLMWLRDMAEYMDNLDVSEFFKSGSEFGSNHKQKMYFEHVRDLYAQFLATGVEDEAKKEESLRRLAEKCYGKPDDIEELLREEQILLQKVAAMDQKIEERQKLDENNQILQNDIEQSKEYIQKMKVYIAEKEEALRHIDQQQKEKDAELAALQAKNLILDQECENQEINADKFQQYLTLQRERYAQELDQRQKNIDVLKKESWDMEIKVAQNADKIGKMCQEFNKLYSELKISSKSCHAKLKSSDFAEARKIAENFDINLPEFDIQRTLNPAVFQQLSEIVVPAIQKAKCTTQDTLVTLEKMLAITEQESHELFLKKTDLDFKHKMIDIKLKQKETEIENKREEMDRVINSLEMELNAVNEEIDEVKKAENQSEQEAEMELQALDNLVKQREQEFREFREQEEKYLESAMDWGSKIMANIEERKRKFTKELMDGLESND